MEASEVLFSDAVIRTNALFLTGAGPPLHRGPHRPLGYLLDENLSPRLRLGFSGETRVIHARELGDQPTDPALLQGNPPPWVVRLHCGNLRARDMRLFLEAHWAVVESKLPECNVIDVYLDRVEGLI